MTHAHIAIVLPIAVVLHWASLLRIILRVISAAHYKMAAFSLWLDLAIEVNRHFLENERGDL